MDSDAQEYERRKRQRMKQRSDSRVIDGPIEAKPTKEKTPIDVSTMRRRLIDSSSMTAKPMISLDPRDSGKPTRKFIPSWSRLSQLDQKDDKEPTEKMDKDESVATGSSKARNNSIPAKSSDVVLLSEGDERHNPKTVRRRAMDSDNSNSALPAILPSSETLVAKMKRQATAPEQTSKKTAHSPYTSLHKSSATTSKSTKDTIDTVDAAALSNRLSHSPGDPSSPVQYPKRVSLLDKAYALGMGTFPQAPLSCVRLGAVFEFDNPGMVIQFGPDRLIINTNESRAKIKHDEIKTFEYNTDGVQAIIVIHTTPEATTSILESLHDPVASSSRSLKLTLFSKDNTEIILEQCKTIAKKRVYVKALSSEDAEKILEAKFERTPASATNPSAGSKLEPKLPTPPPPLRADKHDGTLFLFPFKGSARSKSIAVHATDLDRLKNDEQLNDTLIEFGLKHVYANLQTTDPELADKTHMFNSFFYERLLSKNGKGIQYDAVKSWTNKTDLFSKKYIIVPINENYHWYLAIITNPGLLLKSTGKSNHDNNSNKDVEGKSPSPLTRGSSADAPSSPAVGATTTSPSFPKGSSPAKSLSQSSGDADAENPKDALQNLLFPGTSRMTTRATHGKQDDSGHFRRSLRSSSTSLPLLPVDPEEKPYIIVLDSLGGRHPAVYTRLRAYLQQELLTRKNIERAIDSKVLPGKQGKCPEQDNFSDCGLFLLHYAEVFLKHPGPLLDGMVNMRGGLNEYWDIGELSDKRQQYVAIMESLAVQYQDNLVSQKNGEQSSSSNQETDQSRSSTPQAHSQQTQSRPSSPRPHSDHQKHHNHLVPKP
ncbi:hypothetical protein BGZ58_004690 [Dissophora ornata]|nr:hypothetical protein BGZ58_004690 [Dissophora ornata]